MAAAGETMIRSGRIVTPKQEGGHARKANHVHGIIPKEANFRLFREFQVSRRGR